MAFKQYLKEAEKPKTVAVLFGRMNPPTKGHEENVEGLKNVAKQHNADHLVIASHSNDTKKNPLTSDQKVKHIKRAFPNTNVTSSSKEKPTLFHHLSDLHKKGYTHVMLAGGSDRAGELGRLNDYNGKEGKHGYYNFKSIKTVNTGERKQGVSGTDMRTHASNNDFASFRKGLPSKLAAHEGHAKELFHDTRSGMGLHENNVSNLDYDNREQEVMTISFKNYNKQPKVPFLLMTNEQKSRMFEEKSKELAFDGLTTHHFYMCPGAYEQFKPMIETISSGNLITNGSSTDQVNTGVIAKPDRVRQMQFRQYTDI